MICDNDFHKEMVNRAILVGDHYSETFCTKLPVTVTPLIPGGLAILYIKTHVLGLRLVRSLITYFQTLYFVYH